MTCFIRVHKNTFIEDQCLCHNVISRSVERNARIKDHLVNAIAVIWLLTVMMPVALGDCRGTIGQQETQCVQRNYSHTSEKVSNVAALKEDFIACSLTSIDNFSASLAVES